MREEEEGIVCAREGKGGGGEPVLGENAFLSRRPEVCVCVCVCVCLRVCVYVYVCIARALSPSAPHSCALSLSLPPLSLSRTLSHVRVSSLSPSLFLSFSLASSHSAGFTCGK